MSNFLVLLFGFLCLRYFEYFITDRNPIKDSKYSFFPSRFVKGFYYLALGVLLFLQFYYPEILKDHIEIEVGEIVALMAFVESTDLFFEWLGKENKTLLESMKKVALFTLVRIVIILSLFYSAIFATLGFFILVGLVILIIIFAKLID